LYINVIVIDAGIEASACARKSTTSTSTSTSTSRTCKDKDKDKDKDLTHKDQDNRQGLKFGAYKESKDKDKITYSYLLQLAAKPTIVIKQQQ